MPDHTVGPVSPNGGNLGQFWFNTNTNQMNYYDGTNWVPLGTPGATLNASVHLPLTGGPLTNTGIGFLYIPMVQGSIGGVPALTGSANGRAAMVYDHINNRMWVYNGSAWKSAVFA